LIPSRTGVSFNSRPVCASIRVTMQALFAVIEAQSGASKMVALCSHDLFRTRALRSFISLLFRDCAVIRCAASETVW
jgi:hypothetical protein